jgi:hypothetical protein
LKALARVEGKADDVDAVRPIRDEIGQGVRSVLASLDVNVT